MKDKPKTIVVEVFLTTRLRIKTYAAKHGLTMPAAIDELVKKGLNHK